MSGDRVPVEQANRHDLPCNDFLKDIPHGIRGGYGRGTNAPGVSQPHANPHKTFIPFVFSSLRVQGIDFLVNRVIVVTRS